MFSIISLVLAATSASAGIVSPHHRALAHQARATQPATYAAGYLEDYQTYHARYLAIDCEAKHNTTYFDKCCHPMLATENLKDDRAPDCAPSAAALASASAAYATSTVSPGGSDDGDCDDEPAAPSATPVPTPSKNAAAKESPASSSSSKKPEPSFSKKPDPATSSPKATATSGSSSSGSSSSGSSSSSSGSLASLVQQVFSGGIATFFTQNGIAGACGQVHPDSAIVAALQTSQYAGGKHCGQFIQVLNKKNNKTHKVLVADECPTCDGSTSVDFSKGAFAALGGTVEEGIFDIEWGFLN